MLPVSKYSICLCSSLFIVFLLMSHISFIEQQVQPIGISRFNFSFHTIAPPLDLYGLPSSFGKSNCTNQ